MVKLEAEFYNPHFPKGVFTIYYSRRQLVREILISQPFTSLKELEERFPDVSSMTLRRDIEFCERHGDVIKVRGGARSMKFIVHTEEESYSRRANENRQRKQRISRAAAKLIEPGRSIFIDAGTTAMELTNFIPEARLNITTSGANVALALIKHDKIMVNLVGGLLNKESYSVSGPMSYSYINDINIDVAFISPSGFSLENGFTSGNYSECELKSLIMKKARKTVLLVLADKIGKSLPFTFCKLEDIDMIITDRPLPEDIYKSAKAQNVSVIVAE